MCSICFESYYAPNHVTLSCGHEYHATCMIEWLIECWYDGTCPMCRTAIPFDPALRFEYSEPPPLVLRRYYLRSSPDAIHITIK